jgi:general secretion pathway protein D
MFHNNHIHKAILILSLILCGCNDKINSIDKAEIDKDLQQPIFEPLQKKPAKISKINKSWNEKIDITLTKDVPIALMLKNIANKFGVKLLIDVPDIVGINYVAKNKPFFEVLIELSKMHDWKLQINGVNGRISKDSPYMHTYSVPFLVGDRKSTATTSFSGNSNEKNSGFDTGSNSNLASSSNLDTFDELRKNIEILFPAIEGEDQVKFSVHKQGGVLTVIAKQKNHRMLAKYINLLSTKINKQVLIEAKIFEIHLYEKYETGIDWAKIASFGLASAGYPVSGSQVGGNMFSFELNPNIANHMSSFKGGIAYFLGEFGKVQSVSNPRIMIANNNTGIFKAVDNKVFFRMKQNMIADSMSNSGGNNSNRNNNNSSSLWQVSSTIETVPVGIIILVQPTIDDNGRITIALHPTISEVHEEVNDPAVDIMAANYNTGKKIESKIPVIKKRELNTVFTTEEGKIILIGGLLYSSRKDIEGGLPLPGAAAWFGGKKMTFSEKKEIVMVIQAQVIEYDQNDEDLIYIE